MQVVIGVDPHKASHTAVAIDEAEDENSSVHVRATQRQVERLVRWAELHDLELKAASERTPARLHGDSAVASRSAVVTIDRGLHRAEASTGERHAVTAPRALLAGTGSRVPVGQEEFLMR